ncbi:hypothetical protein [Rothia sp. P7208]|uniref:hypothetical protein n=1 Tax=Rothia sp. P7208 TaxID=3402660 RepID=UPI003AD6C498
MRFRSSVDRILAFWVIGMFCAIALALISLTLINRLVYAPEGQVHQYFQALERGKGDHALGILDAHVPDADGTLLDGKALKNSVSEIKNFSIIGSAITDGGSKAQVDVEYVVDGSTYRSSFHLTKVGSHWGVFDQWHIDPQTLPIIRLQAPAVHSASINGVKVGIDSASQNFAVLYPGVFSITYESSLYSAEQQKVLIRGNDPHETTVVLRLVPSENAQNSITSQVSADLNECASNNSLFPVNCPFEYDFTGRVQGNVSWTIQKYPTTKAVINDEGRWVLPSSSGIAQISFTELNLYTGQQHKVKEDVPFTFSADLDVSDHEVVVRPRF